MLVGVVAGLLTLGVATLLAAVLERLTLAGGTPAPVAAVAEAFIERTPAWLKNFAVATFGTYDKAALLVGTLVVLAGACAAVGVLARRRLRAALVLFAGLGAVGLAAVLSRPHATALDAVPTLLGVGAGLWWLARESPTTTDPATGVSRRAVFGAGLGAASGAAGVALDHVALTGPAAQANLVAVPRPAASATVAVPAAAALDVPGLTPFVVPNADFYRIDTAFVVPRVDVATWRLRVTGLVEREVTVDWATLVAKPLREAMVTLTCVSNEVGGDLVGNAVWTGWPVRELLAQAGVRPGADMVLQTSADGWTCGTPLQALTDNRNALLAVAMNGQLLPDEHGFPARVVVPGLYGYVSATKWVTELKVTTFAQDEGYWTPRGWAALGPVKLSSRIDVPRSGARVAAGTVAVAGVAWAQHTGIATVEVSVDGGPWHPARLAGEASIDAWRQWVYSWQATPGAHTLTVRATDRTGALQVADAAPPAPDGATGLHTVAVTVTG